VNAPGRTARVASILRAWDPIGVQPGIRAPADEYDSYAPEVVALFERRHTVAEIAAHLAAITRARMGLRARPSVGVAIASAIVAALAPGPSPSLATPAIEVQGFEHDWLASDALGQVALFTTAGSGFPPAGYLRDMGAHERAIEQVLSGAPRAAALSAPKIKPGLVNTWQLLAERGFFGFDGGRSDGSYQRVAVPSRRSTLADLPGTVAIVAVSVQLLTLRFHELERVTPEDLGAGAHASGV
jgi:hypothetical protein